jgi:dGTPase
MTPIIRNHDFWLEQELRYLAPYAAKNSSKLLTRRGVPIDIDILRLDFQRDRDRIIHSRAFRRLMHKTQVFIANKGDHFRNRLTHTLEVAQIARSISKALGLNEELTEAIALGHDLGHTPFGHVVERVLYEITTGNRSNCEFNIPNCGGFKHNFQSVHLVDNIEQDSSGRTGLNLTLAVREGILKHTGSKIKMKSFNKTTLEIEPYKAPVSYPTLDLTNMEVNRPSFTLEGQVVAIADEIAQVTHDLEDGIRSTILKIEDIKDTALIQYIYHQIKQEKSVDWTLDTLKNSASTIRNTLITNMIGFLIYDVIDASKTNIANAFPDEKYPERYDHLIDPLISFSNNKDTNVKVMVEAFEGLLTNLVINSQEVSTTDSKAEYIIVKLFKAYYVHPQQLPTYILEKYFKRKGVKLERKNINEFVLQNDPDYIRLICDHIASMTDQYASREYTKIYEPEFM